MRHFPTFAALLALGIVLAGCGGTPKGKPDFTAALTGDQAVPPVTTQALGQAEFYLTENGMELDYRLSVKGIEQVRTADLYLAEEGRTGDEIAGLYTASPTSNAFLGNFSGVLGTGKIQAAQLIGPMHGKTVKDLLNEIKAGHVFVVVQTNEHPQEVRGKVQRAVH